MTKEQLYGMSIPLPDKTIERKIKERWDHIAKPLDGLGRFEKIIARLGAITGTERVTLSSKAVLVFCADNGIVEEGISQTGQEVTAIVAENMTKGESAVCQMAASIGASVKVVDIGVNRAMQIEGILDRKITYGTRNFLKEPAMSETEVLQALQTGIELVEECKQAGYHILAMGEMGIGNTTTSSAVAAALLGCSAADVTGKGAGLNEEGLLRKKTVIQTALEKYKLENADPIQVLAHVGGLDIAGLTGMCIGGALHKMPIVMDGAISAIAALAAERIAPGAKEYLIPSHLSREPVAKRIMAELDVFPVIDGDMALGEGTGAVMMLALLDMALSVYEHQVSFQEVNIEQYARFEDEEE